MSQAQSKWKIYRDDAQERQTSHWDMDYLPAAEYETLMNNQRESRQAAQKRRAGKRRALGFALGAVLVLLVLLLARLVDMP